MNFPYPDKSCYMRFSTRAILPLNTPPPRGHVAMPGNSFECHPGVEGRKECYWHSWVEVRVDAQHSTTYRTAPNDEK